jgi:hypothetical protein
MNTGSRYARAGGRREKEWRFTRYQAAPSRATWARATLERDKLLPQLISGELRVGGGPGLPGSSHLARDVE